MRFINYLNEAGLGGKSRSGGISNWEHYVIKGFNSSDEYTFDTDAILYNENLEAIDKVNKGEKLRIIETDLITKNRSNYAKISYKNSKYLVRINDIQKPTGQSGDVVIPGGKNSKEFTPDKLGLNGKSFTTPMELASVTLNQIKSIYSDKKFSEIKNYIVECLSLVSGQSLILEYKKSYNIKESIISTSDVKILSKNFGEILAGIFILKTNKKCKALYFPSDISQQLYDFYIKTNKGNHYYSVKSLGGSSTSMENINFIIKNFSENNTFFNKYKHEIDVIRTIINNKEEGKTTLTNIERFFNKFFPNKTSEIVGRLNSSISKNLINDLSQQSLNRWFNEMINILTEDEFINLMKSIYNDILGDIGKTPQTTETVLKQMYKMGNADKFKNGYLYYPMGSYIINYLNNKGDYKEVLNQLLNYGSWVTQIEVNLSINSIDIIVSPFKKSNFSFTYNGMSKAPGNRPLGFKSKG